MNDLLTQDSQFQILIKNQPDNFELLFNYNEFRIKNAPFLPRTRPQILMGGPFQINYPNLHSFHLFEIADVVCLTCEKNFNYASAIYCTPSTLFCDILKKLPKGFSPDFYWDNQVEKNHFIPRGIEMAPFPIIASVCHMFLEKSIEHTCELFDRVLPISTFYGNILRKKYPEKILDLPFGLNWGSFHYILNNLKLNPLFDPNPKKTIDVCLTFGENNAPFYRENRNLTIQLTKQFKEKYGQRFSIEIAPKLPTVKYAELLQKSKIAINVTGIHGPYNYRTIEAMCSKTMVFQYDWEGDFFENKFSELFKEDLHGVTFNFDNFESKLLYYLENQEQIKKITAEASAFLNEKYQYRDLYKELIKIAKEIETTTIRNSIGALGSHHVDMIYYNQTGKAIDRINSGAPINSEEPSWIHYNNLMVLACTYKEPSIGYFFLVSLSAKILNKIRKPDLFAVTLAYKNKALEMAPEEYRWLIEWNYLLLAIENKKASTEDIKNMIGLLTNQEVAPFNENELIFKYYLTTPLFPHYFIGGDSRDFYVFNMDLIQVIDQPKKRALLYQNYALKAARYFLEIVNQNVEEKEI